uniref:Transmembrane protein n=1 Tax=Pithovirus LCPAC001 TaxID=2506585 RepID=A0A481Z1S8_9VIRU|nr:MAG: uncharacterized protein LCPAC001_01850 [Pithovirus LCPAC001]
MFGLEIFLLFIVLIIIVVIAVLNSVAAVRITTITNYEADIELKKAHSRLIISAIIGWVGLIIIVGILAYYFSKVEDTAIAKPGEEGNSTTGAGLKVFLFVAVVLIFITGILSAIAAVELDKSKNKDVKETGARSLSNSAAVAGIIGAIIVIITLIIAFTSNKKAKEGKSDSDESDSNSIDMEELAAL